MRAFKRVWKGGEGTSGDGIWEKEEERKSEVPPIPFTPRASLPLSMHTSDAKRRDRMEQFGGENQQLNSPKQDIPNLCIDNLASMSLHT